MDDSFRGKDGLGKEYTNVDDVWNGNIDNDTDLTSWYGKAEDYWKKASDSVDGMLGGLGHLSDIDETASRSFIARTLVSQLKLSLASGKQPRKLSAEGRAVDCGAGIGRVSSQVLSKFYRHITLVDVNQTFLDTAKANSHDGEGRYSYTCVGLQGFTPEANTYDMIWVQWVIIYLTDDDAVRFFERCKAGLREGGTIVVKENHSRGDDFWVDKDDNSIMRGDQHLRQLYARSGLKVVDNELQQGFPQNLFPVRTYSLQPIPAE